MQTQTDRTMQLISASGQAVAVHERGWPLAGLDTPAPQRNSNALIQLAMSPGGTPNYATYAQIYRTNPWVYAAVQAISWGLSRMPLHVYQLDAQGNHRRVRGDLPGGVGRPNTGMALDNLLRQPEPGVSRNEWVRKLAVDKMVYGNALVDQDRPGGAGVPTALWHVPWRRVELIPGEYTPVLGYNFKGQIGERFAGVDEVIHFGRGGDLDSPLGLSPIAPLRYTVALHDALQRHLNAYFNNAARPSGILKVQPGTSADAQKLIQEQIRKLYASPEQAGKIMVTSAEWQAMSAEPQASNIIELAKLSREEIAAAFQVPPPILGILERAIRANVTELRSQFIRDVLGPHAAAFEGDLNAQLIGQNPSWAGYFIAFDMNEALRPDLEARAGVYERMRHVWTPNYMRQLEGLPPLEGEAGKYADTVWMPSGQVPLGLPQPQEGNGPPGDGTTPAAPANTPDDNPADEDDDLEPDDEGQVP